MRGFFWLGMQLTVFFATALVMVWFITRPSPAAKRLAGITQVFALGRPSAVSTAERLRAQVLQMIRHLRSKLGLTETRKLRARFLAAGLRDPTNFDSYFALRLLGPLAGIVLWSFVPKKSFFWMLVLVGVLYLLPDLGLKFPTKKRRRLIELGFPDALEQAAHPPRATALHQRTGLLQEQLRRVPYDVLLSAV